MTDDPAGELARMYGVADEIAARPFPSSRRYILNVYPDWPDEEIRKTQETASAAALNEPGLEVVLRYHPGEYQWSDSARLIAGEPYFDMIMTVYGGSDKMSVSYGDGREDDPLAPQWNLP